ncbi:MAG: LysR family transcriptional regulator [Gammaproteobacteria bacterium]|nr:LysR family transcriptional regulator [Gammaproteobacteria bacterium]
MRLRHIEVFHAVYNCGSITAAAKQLSVSQPSVSKVLAHAEQQLGFQLFKRQKGKILPTREAERLIHHIDDVYSNIGELRRMSKNLGIAETGRIRIAMAPALGIDLIPSAIASYLKLHPQTTFEIETLHLRQVFRALKELRVDFGIVFDPPATPGFMIDRLATAELVAISHESMFVDKGKTLTLDDLDGVSFINLSTRSPLGQLLANRIESGGIQLRSVANVETYQMAKALVAHGAGIALIDEITAKSAGHKNIVVRRMDPPLQFEVSLVHAESTPFSVLNQQFIGHLKDATRSFLQTPFAKGS